VNYIGTLAAICTTTAFIPQILKIRRQGGDDLSYPMLLYITGTLLWLAYGLLIHAAAVIWANSLTAILVATAMAMKATYSPKTLARKERPEAAQEADAVDAES
jgi:MtN3 and saliva related transmembrane protein